MKKKIIYYLFSTLAFAALAFFFGKMGFWGAKTHFLVETNSSKIQKALTRYLEQSDISFNLSGDTFWTDQLKDKNKLIANFFEKKYEDFASDNHEYLYLENESERKSQEGLENYILNIENILKDINPHLKYQTKLNLIGEIAGNKEYGVDVTISDVLKRDNSKILISFLKMSLDSFMVLDISVKDDRGKILFSEKESERIVVSNLIPKIEKEVTSLIEPIVDSKKTYILVENKDSGLEIGILVEESSELNASERKVIEDTISNKIKLKFKKDAIVSIKGINNISYIDKREENPSSGEDRFLYLLLFTTLGILSYLVISIYLKNRQELLFEEKKKKIHAQKLEEKENLKRLKKELGGEIEKEIIYKVEASTKSFESFIKKPHELNIAGYEFSSGEMIAIIIKNLQKESRLLLFEGLGSFVVERLVSIARSEHLKKIKMKEEVGILQYFLEFLVKENNFFEFEETYSKKEVESQLWHKNHYVELIKNMMSVKEYREILSFFERENPLFSTIIFVSLSERMQQEIWKMLDFSLKKRIAFALVDETQIKPGSIEMAYEFLKEAS